jgi:hypothetical protein
MMPKLSTRSCIASSNLVPVSNCNGGTTDFLFLPLDFVRGVHWFFDPELFLRPPALNVENVLVMLVGQGLA